MNYIDMHCDTLAMALAQKKETVYALGNTMVDVKRLQEAGAAAQFFAMFLPQREEPEWFGLETMPEPEELMMQMYAVYQKTMEAYPDLIAPAHNFAQYESNRKAGKISAFLTIENGALVNGNMENLKKYHDMGVGLMTLTWNDANCFGMNHSKDAGKMSQGLTDFGKEAISYMNELGIIIDVSHLSDGGFYDVAELSKKPFVASHSNCRALAPATRNLTDEMIKLLAQKGGVIGINLEPTFVNKNADDTTSRVQTLCNHVEHLRQIGGEDCVAIGTDFDGIEGTFEIRDCTYLHLLWEELQRRGFKESFLEKLAYRNVERVIREVMK